MQLREGCERVVVIPYTLSIVDCFFVFRALQKRQQREVVEIVAEMAKRSDRVSFSTVFDFYDFDRDLDKEEATLISDGAFIHWDVDARFVSIGGSSAFVEEAAPYPEAVRRHYFIEGMSTLVSDDLIISIYDGVSK